MRYTTVALMTALMLPAAALADAGETFELTLKDHVFTPSELTIPAGKQVKLIVKNLDPTPAEFESRNFRAEKIVPGGGEVSIHIGPLKPGTYAFFDEFHEDKAKGTLVAK